VNSFGDLLGILNTQGYLIKKGQKIYQLISTNY